VDKAASEKNGSEKQLSNIEAHPPIHKILNNFGNKFHNRGPSHSSVANMMLNHQRDPEAISIYVHDYPYYGR
jgi:hypothetical protein